MRAQNASISGFACRPFKLWTNNLAYILASLSGVAGHNHNQEVSEYGSVYGSKLWNCQFSVDSQLGTCGNLKDGLHQSPFAKPHCFPFQRGDSQAVSYPLIQNDYRQEKFIFGGSTGKSCKSPRTYYREGSYRTGAHTGESFWGILFRGSTGKSCNSPGAITWKNVYRIILVIISPYRVISRGTWRHTPKGTILFRIITRTKLFFSNYLGRYSYSFRARQELISVTVTVLWVWREYVFTVTVRYSYIKNGLRNYFPKITVTVT